MPRNNDLRPGSDEAKADGCTCSARNDNAGRIAVYWCEVDCPLHGERPPLSPRDSAALQESIETPPEPSARAVEIYRKHRDSV